ncbi:NUDIX hydrolase (macronuclear) [Tetrahymena thermophila SB210]|uniref:m7GpppN-mRNA hydrolase NUDT17 n=2 Tax=Tetrahymena thermophila TaxID=5911 RepID=Q22TE9_TETTS|nr:NUDIX hydrolase [Tetrahymena thermophila SB210]ADG46031.1 Nud1p [Tetrahymena thermophila]EAR88489.1 NUDIX hydrolase [Tetrahymena thermophila SB210]|eukprot:XP_001008734.1 NUDIX hydrolase [Tetrahymena thermophila SB210]
MDANNKGKKQNQTNSKPEVIKLKVGDDQQFQKIGICLLEKVKNEQSEKQLEEVQVNLYYDQKLGYAKLIDAQKQQQDRQNLVYQNIILQHANTCPHFQFSRLDQQFQLSQQTTGVAVCGIIIDKNNYVLLTKRNPEMRTYPRCWVFPGGQVDLGESFLNTVFREIKEEVGLNILLPQSQQEENFDFEEEFEQQSPKNQQNTIEEKEGGIEEEQENMFKRQTRLQKKIQDQKKKVETNQQMKKEDFLTKSAVHLMEDPKPLFLYESVFPTDIKINYPQRSSLVIFYALKIKESFKDIQLSQQRKEIDYSAWIPLELLNKLIEENAISDSEFLQQQIETGISINHNYFPIGHNCFVGKYPNQLGEGIGEAHIKAIRMLNLKYNKSTKVIKIK